MKPKLALAAVLLLGVVGNLRAEMHGAWTASIEDAKPGRIYLSIVRKQWNHNGRALNIADLAGLSSAQIGAGSMTQVQFQLAREAGTFRFEGTFKNGDGAGQWTFQANRGYPDAVRALGVPFELRRHRENDTEEEQLFTLALMDVSASFIRSMQAIGYRETLDQYVSMRIHNVTPEFVRDLKELGYTDIPAKKLVQLKIHGVDTNFIRKMNAIE